MVTSAEGFLRHDGPVVQISISCTLTTDEGVDRLDRCRQLLSQGVASIDGAPPAVRLQLADGDAVLLEAVHLAELEKACCTFFDFAVCLAPDGRWLTVTVPPDASSILEGLLSLAHSNGS